MIRNFFIAVQGSNLSLVVELLAGSLVGAAVEDKLKAKSWGNLIAVIDPALLGSAAAFEERVRGPTPRACNERATDTCACALSSSTG
jgi:LDH2 family malate/lactate/ureidoglycolate dehydrogenase